MAKYKLTDSHPFNQRVAELMEHAERLGISIDFSRCNMRTFITDTKSGKDYDLEDVDSGRAITNFPSMCEYKLTYEN